MNSKKIRLLQGLPLFLILQSPSAWANPNSYSAKDLLVGEERRVKREENSIQNSKLKTQNPLDLDPALIKKSPVLQRWVDEVPDVASDIKNDPSFRTRIQFGYSNFSSDSAGFNLGIKDLQVDRTRLTLSADYQAAFEGDRQSWGTDLHYYMRPLGSYVNVAPVVGYRHLKNNGTSTNGVNLGFRLLLALSRGGGSDISLTQTWVAPGSDEETGISTLSFGYALTHQLRLSTDLQRQNTKRGKDDRIGIGLEWML